MSDARVNYTVADGVAIVTMNRPHARNAQSWRLLEEMDAAFEAAVADSSVKVIVLKGAGDHFSAGHDTGTPEQKEYLKEHPFPIGPRGIYMRNKRYCDYSLRWRNLPVPTVAAVQGYCLWGGWMVACSMDVVIAAENALFLPSLFQYFEVPWSVGTRRAKGLLFENRLISAEEAREYGFVYRVVADAQLDAAVMEYARRIAEEDAFELRMIKRACNQTEDIMGFTAAVTASHDINAVKSVSNGVGAEKPLMPMQGRRQVGKVERALARGVLGKSKSVP